MKGRFVRGRLLQCSPRERGAEGVPLLSGMVDDAPSVLGRREMDDRDGTLQVASVVDVMGDARDTTSKSPPASPSTPPSTLDAAGSSGGTDTTSTPSSPQDVSVHVEHAEDNTPQGLPRGSPAYSGPHVGFPLGPRASSAFLRLARKIRFFPLQVLFLIFAVSLVPIVIVGTFYAVVPMGGTFKAGDFSSMAVWLCVVNPVTFTFWSYLNTILFIGCLDGRPPIPVWKLCVPPILLTYAAEVGVMSLVVFFAGEFPFIGIISFVISLVATFTGLALVGRMYFNDVEPDASLSPTSAAPFVDEARPADKSCPDLVTLSGDVPVVESPLETSVHRETSPETSPQNVFEPHSDRSGDEQLQRAASSLSAHSSGVLENATSAEWCVVDDAPPGVSIRSACTRREYNSLLAAFLKNALVFFAFIGVLSAFVVGMGQSGKTAQRVYVVALGLVAFIFKKIELHFSDSFPMEISMLLAGLWIEHLTVVFLTVTYPYVTTPTGTYLVYWGVGFIQNAAYLLFMTDRWFVFRVWIKSTLRNGVTCRGFRRSPDDFPIEDDVSVNDRGHSNQHPGYRRRQFTFYIFKIVSQASGLLFYIVIATIMRYGINADDFPFSDESHHPVFGSFEPDRPLSFEAYRNSLIYASSYLFFVICALYFGVWIIRRFYRPLFDDMRQFYFGILNNERYYSFVAAIMVGNSFMVCCIFQQQMRIWYYDSD